VRRDVGISALILLGVFCLYFLSVDGHAPSLKRKNILFDADIAPVSRVIAGDSVRNLSRHPLYGVFLGVPGAWVDSVLNDPIATGRLSSAAAGAVASLIAFGFFAGLLGSRLEALGFCLLVTCSASVWLLAAVPETHIYNHAAVVSSFALLRGMAGETAVPRVRRYTAVAILAGVFLMGITLTNIVYVALAFGLALWTSAIPLARRAGWFSVFLLGVLVLFLAFSAVALHAEPAGANMLTTPWAPFVNPFIAWAGLTDTGSLVLNARMFLLGNVIASHPSMTLVPTIDGVQQMIQLDRIGLPEILIVVYLVLACAVLAHTRSKERMGLTGLFALVVILFNLALHQVFFGNGQPFIFSIHTVFPLVVLLALLYRQSRARTKRLWIGGLLCIVVVHNALFIATVNELLARRCVGQAGKPPICASWDPPMNP
jgi:hypothetical protein